MCTSRCAGRAVTRARWLVSRPLVVAARDPSSPRASSFCRFISDNFRSAVCQTSNGNSSSPSRSSVPPRPPPPRPPDSPLTAPRARGFCTWQEFAAYAGRIGHVSSPPEREPHRSRARRRYVAEFNVDRESHPTKKLRAIPVCPVVTPSRSTFCTQKIKPERARFLR